MSGPSDERETLPSETSLASEDTVQADSAPGGGGPNIVRSGRRSTPRTKLGRYTLGQLLGRGGIGEVYEADDPELGRRVAIKILREGRGDTTTLLREAQALAKLEHPNVVAVYDVGSEDGTVFVVMPLIAGESIDKWLRGRHAGPHAIVAAFVQAGRGLAAAHAAGLVHCDFKPGNVLVDKQGAVRVGDFGLARGADEDAAIAGTPAYMAPEQFAGKPTAASDQFSFCVALWEVLAGELPYETPTSIDSGMQRAADRVRKPLPRGARIPARVTRALERGLAIDPAQRFASMPDLLAALAPPRRTGFAVAALIPVLAGGAVAAWSLGRGAPPPTAPPGPPPPPQLDVGHARALTTYGASACAYSPTVLDDGTVVFDRTEHDAVDLYAVPLAGGTPRQLTSAPAWEWRSSRGRKPGEIIYLAQDTRTGVGAVIALDLATRASTTLVDSYVTDAAAIGDDIYYVPKEIAGIVAKRGARETKVSDAVAQLIAASPAGDRLAGCEDRAGLSMLFVLELANQHIEHYDDSPCGSRPAFGADGRNVYYQSHDGIHRKVVATGHDELAAPDVRAVGGIAVALDGGELVYSDCESRTRMAELDGGHRELFTDATASRPVAGPHGELVWTREVHGTRVVIARFRDGTEAQVTGSDSGSVRPLAISPDGTRLLFVGTGKHAGIHVVVLSAVASVVRLTDDPNDVAAAWSSNDEIVVLRADDERARSGPLYTMRADGSALTRTGTRAFNVFGGAHGRVLISTTERVFWYDVAKGTVCDGPALPDDTREVHMSPNGVWLAIDAGEEAKTISRMRLDPPGKVERLEKIPSDVAVSGDTIDDDGHVYAALANWSGDLHVIPAAPGSKL